MKQNRNSQKPRVLVPADERREHDRFRLMDEYLRTLPGSEAARQALEAVKGEQR